MNQKEPEFFEIKCDYRSCDLMATRYFPKIPFMVEGEGVIARDIKVCEYHTRKLVNRLEIENSSKLIPYIKNGEQVQCVRCGHDWIPTYSNKRFIDSDKYMRLPQVCSRCKSKSYRIKTTAVNGIRSTLECLIV